MASYEKAEALQTYVKKNLKKINDLIQDLPDISEFEDVIDDISDVSTYIGGLDIQKKISYLSRSLSSIKENTTNLKENKVTLSPESITIESNANTKSYAKENFLKDKFPIIPD